jgi:phage/plasmid-like protein (TIGR03299 family)
MSSETMKWLNTMTLVGQTDKRGTAWHYKREMQDGVGNHFPGFVPRERVEALFFDAVEGTAESTYMTDSGMVLIRDPKRKQILRPPGTFGADDKGAILSERLLEGQPGDERGWKLHQYKEWLVNTVGDILDTSTSDLGIASAGLLQGGALAWLQIETPENIETAIGFTFRPFILATTAHTGGMSTTYKQAVTAVVCDNTLAIAQREDGGTARVRHTRYSAAKLGDIREKLGILHRMSDDFAQQVEALADITVTDSHFDQFIETLVPFVDSKGKPMPVDKRGRKQAKRDKIVNLYRNDPRVTPWAGSALGVLQAVNTFEHHVQGTTGKSGGDIAQRNMLRVVKGDRDRMDRDTVSLITDIVEGKFTEAVA